MSGLASLFILGMIAWAVWTRRPREERRIEDVLAEATRVAIITDDQRRRILAQTRPAGPSARFSGATWLAILAGLFVVAGVSLLIATNWEHIGPLARIVSFLLLLTAVGEGAIRTRQRSTILAVSLDVVWLVLPLLGIGLYGQTFQLSGDPVMPFFTWLVLAAPIAWTSTHLVVRAIHTTSVVAVLFVGSFFTDGVLSLHGAPSATAWCLSVATLAAATVQSLRLLPRGQRYHCIGVVAGWILGVMVATDLVDPGDFGSIAMVVSSLSTLWLVAVLWLDGDSSEVLPAATAWLAVPYATSFAWHLTAPIAGSVDSSAGVAVSLLLVAALLGAMRVPLSGLTDAAPRVIVGRMLLAFPALLSLPLLTERVEILHLDALLANGFLLASAIAFLWNGSTTRRSGQVNVGILILLVTLVTRFVDVLGTFVQSGIGFIVAGLLLAGIAYALERTRRRLIESPEGLA